MTTIDSDSADKRPARPPISVHPAFPGIVALWFAALLGMIGAAAFHLAVLGRLRKEARFEGVVRRAAYGACNGNFAAANGVRTIRTLTSTGRRAK